MEHITYSCDKCGKDIEQTASGKLYGRLRCQFEAPAFSHSIVVKDFCGYECMVKYIRAELSMRFS